MWGILVLPIQHKLITEWNLKTLEFVDTESYRFGPGPVTRGVCAALVPLGIGGKSVILRISVVPGDVPLLLSHEVMVLLDLSYHSRSKTVHVGELDTTVTAVCPKGGHPMIDLLEFPSEGFQGKFDMSEGLLEVRLDETSRRRRWGE